MRPMASQITSLVIVYSSVYSGADQRKYQNSASLAFMRGIHRWPVNFPHEGSSTRKTFPLDYVIMISPVGALSHYWFCVWTDHVSWCFHAEMETANMVPPYSLIGGSSLHHVLRYIEAKRFTFKFFASLSLVQHSCHSCRDASQMSVHWIGINVYRYNERSRNLVINDNDFLILHYTECMLHLSNGMDSVRKIYCYSHMCRHSCHPSNKSRKLLLYRE